MKNFMLILLSILACFTANAQTPPGTENSITIANQKSINIEKSQLTNDPVLRLLEADTSYHIVSYKASFVPHGQGRELEGPFTMQGSSMATGKAAEILDKAVVGDRIYFEDIVAESTGKPQKKLYAAVMIK